MAKREHEVSPKDSKRRLTTKNFVASRKEKVSLGDDNGVRATEAFVVNISKWCDNGRYVFEDLEEDMPLFQLQLLHDQKPSVLFQIVAEFRKFLPSLDPSIMSLEELERQKFIRLVVPGDRGLDVDGVGIVAWRVALYAATKDVAETLSIVKQFVEWKCGQADFSGRHPPKLMLTHSSRAYASDAILTDGWEMKPMGSLSLHPFDAAPPRGKRHMVLHVEMGDDDSTYDMLMTGYTWPFRADFEMAGVQGGYIDSDGKREYCRLLQSISADDEGMKRIQGILEDTIKKYAVYLQDNTEKENDPMIAFLRSLEPVHLR